MSTPYFPRASSRACHAPTRRDFLCGLGAPRGAAAFTDLGRPGIGDLALIRLAV